MQSVWYQAIVATYLQKQYNNKIHTWHLQWSTTVL